ncbi:rabenosyn-5-like isoform X1 [Schistocerca americana]|uniref:rabenosyn-5-like isoform X1 n=1 Tax=Schistocerca americana TaxID=7009 RepID=UPI001F4F2E1E|nr:rabenosyn-5-like isoform X1 [Schistocerca americana]
MAEGGEIIEGFLCPICKADLGSPKSLETHFQEEHTEDQDVIKSIKGLLGKAKKRILKLEDEDLPADFRTTAHLQDSFEVLLYEPQEVGAFRSHSEYFRIFRGSRLERYAAETNKLLIRLDKLLRDVPADPVKRKLHEQAIVPWIDDRDVKLCPSCAKSFHVARRKHHCRLCGAIMCNECSHFLELGVAKKMTGSGFGHDLSCTSFNVDKQKNTNSGALEHSSSVASLSSVKSFMDNMTGEQNLRLCVHCKQLLEAREKLKENRSQKPIISQFYERLASYIKEADEMAEVYFKMCESLQCGETAHTPEEAHILRGKLLKLAENIDSLSKKITILGTKDVENPPKGKSLQLQNMIRVASVAYLKEKLLGLSSPTEGQRINNR